jgi:hypothetical protein
VLQTAPLAPRVPLRHHEPVIAQDRLQRAAAFIAQLHRLSINSPHSWRRAQAIGRDIGLADVDLEQATQRRPGSYSGGRTTKALSFWLRGGTRRRDAPPTLDRPALKLHDPLQPKISGCTQNNGTNK